MNIKREQHLLPRSYLKNWFSPESLLPNKTPMVWVIAKDGKRKTARPPADSTFWREYFYDSFTRSGERLQLVEDALADLESRVPSVVEKISAKQPLDEKDACIIDLLVGCMLVRTEKFREAIESGANARARIEKAHSEAYKTEVSDIDLRKRNAFAFGAMVAWEEFAKELGNWRHLVLCPPENYFFITSDTPCYTQVTFGLCGLANPTFELFFPLTPHRGLLLTKMSPCDGYLDVSDRVVDRHNKCLISSCRSYFVSTTNETKSHWF